ncbi:DUF3099 domain-containing protein [Cellulosimicrobium terreum]|nr:DUF3099 domain-containing protein [Cellulosimicrobium terreum]
MSTRGTQPKGRRAEAEAVASITDAQVPLAQDQARRTRRYLIQMGIRVVCFLGAILVGGGWLTWVLVGAAVVLPYVAVLGANAGRDQVHYDTSPMEHRALGSDGAPEHHGIGRGPDDEHPGAAR